MNEDNKPKISNTLSGTHNIEPEQISKYKKQKLDVHHPSEHRFKKSSSSCENYETVSSKHK